MTTTTTRRFGLELECIGMNAQRVTDLLRNAGINVADYAGYTHRVSGQWKVVTDSSVPNGCEVVSPPLKGNAEGFAEVKRVCEILNDAGCDVNKDCGSHCHIELNDATPEHIANIYNRYRKFEALIDSFMPRSRRGENNSYCKSLSTLSRLAPQATNDATCRQRTNRFYKVNLCSFVKYGTIEFRQHSGSLNGSKLVKWVTFLLEFVDASKVAVAPAVAEAQVTPSRHGVYGRLRGHSRAIVDMLQGNTFGLTAQTIADQLGTTRASVQSIVCRLRRQGYHISTGRRYCLIAGSTSEGAQRTVVSSSSDELWNGISTEVKSYYTRRIAILAA